MPESHQEREVTGCGTGRRRQARELSCPQGKPRQEAGGVAIRTTPCDEDGSSVPLTHNKL